VCAVQLLDSRDFSFNYSLSCSLDIRHIFFIEINFDALSTNVTAYTINPPISSTCSIRNSFGILRQRTQTRYQRDTKDEYACEHSIEWNDNEIENSDFIAFPTSLTVAEVGTGHPQQTIGLVPFPRTYIDCKECSQAEKTRPLTIVFYWPYNLCDREESPYQFRSYQLVINWYLINRVFYRAIGLLFLNIYNIIII